MSPKGARDTAYDHDLAMLRLRAYDPAIDDGTWVKKAAINLNLSMTVQEGVEVLVDSAWRPAKELGIRAEGWMDVFDADGERIGNVAGLFALGEPVEGQDDSSRKGCAIDSEPVQVEGFDDLVKIMGMRWTEREVTDTMQVVSEAQGTPQLVVQQLDENGDRYAGRVIVDSKLKAWNFDEDGHVVEVNPPVNVPALPPSEPAAD